MKKTTTKKLFTFILLVSGMFSFTFVTAQPVIRDHRKGQKTTVKPQTEPVTVYPEATLLLAPQVVLYEHANYDAQFKVLGVGLHLLTDFNDVASSIKIPNGLVAVIYEHANEKGGYGNYVDLLEDCPDLSTYNFDNKTSYLNVFSASRPGYVYVRNRNTNNQFVAGHWEREKANGSKPDNSLPAIVSSLPASTSINSTVLSVNGPATTISTLGVQTTEGLTLWERAMNDQMGIIGNDWRGPEYIGTASFERNIQATTWWAKALDGISLGQLEQLDNLNFWVPQQREEGPFKRTLSGKVSAILPGESPNPYIVNEPEIYKDFDLSIFIDPSPNYNNLLSEAKGREYTKLMSAQYYGTAKVYGKPDCNTIGDKLDFSQRIEAEIDAHMNTKNLMVNLIGQVPERNICVYGPWIYDKGHCCHPEIHPAEQIWWRDNTTGGYQYTFSVFCDASERFWWRDQMDDGSKPKPWGAPPIKGLFAIAFEKSLGQTTGINQPVTKFEVSYIDHYNLAEYPNADQVYNLVYQNKTLVSFIPHNNAFKVSYENVGLKPGTSNVIRGFIVIETAVGTCTQVATKIQTTETNVNGALFPVTLNFPNGADPNKVDQKYERQLFKKTKGHYIFSILQSTISSRPPVNGGVIKE